ncbi:diguanylate cyclase [Pelosinus propionicus]|uniref:Diguanylate cyclase (GGDEF) domain-containing protein n=1 Tax=Pelosinus propionicus DSM 13327 TaxID=1123291 RepID=A0A1I4PC91_9FIRM|nr:diguanylate cyclase [Pelosinus propionicus]SFM25225.1 diguanylate cyclase (GGDEF) domain-containing protein [Pelosinus propionicus DSM 13327]
MLIIAHNMLGIFTIILGVIISFITWHGISKNVNHYSYLKGKAISFFILCASILDLWQLLSYSANNPADTRWIIYWMIACIVWACAILYTIRLSLKTPQPTDTFLFYTASLLLIGLLTGLLTNFNFTFDRFDTLPSFLHIDNANHPLVIATLLIAISIHSISLIILRRNFSQYITGDCMQIALLFSILSNLAYLSDISIQTNVFAHLCKCFAYYFILRAVFKFVIKHPYEQLLLFKEQLEQLAVNNAELYKKSEQQRNLLEDTLSKIGTIISSQLNVKDTLDAIADMVTDLMHSRQSLIGLLCTNQTHIQVVATHGINTPPSVIPLNHCLRGQVIAQNIALSINDLSQHPDIQKPQLIFSSIQSMICAPLIHDGEVIGIIEAYSSDLNAFNESDLRFLTALGRHAGTAIASAMLFEKTKLHLEEEKFLSEISQTTSTTIDTNTIIEHCTSHVMKALNADVAVGMLIDTDKKNFTIISSINFNYKLVKMNLDSYPALAALLETFRPSITSANTFAPFAELYDQNASRYMMVLPIAVEQNLLGLILLGWQHFVAPDRLNRISFAFLMSQQIALGLEKAHLYNQIKLMALSDSLTGLANRRNFDMFLTIELKRSASLKRPLSLIMLDLDKFKRYNDSYGHLTGDKLLSQLGQILQYNVRNIDLPARYGGEEFSIILPECSSNEAKFLGEKLREIIENESFPDDIGTTTAKITASLGIATYDPAISATPPSTEKIIELADKALYQAKKEGRNRVITSIIIS